MMQVIRTIYFFFVTILAIIFLFYFIVFTDPGLKFDLAAIKLLTGAKINYQSISGSLNSGISISDFTYQTQQLSVNISEGKIIFDLRALLKRKLIFHSIILQNLFINQNNPKTNKKFSFTPPKIPLYISIEHFNINNINFVSNKFHTTISSLVGKIILNGKPQLNAILNIQCLMSRSSLSLRGTIDKNWNLTWAANIHNLSDFLPNAAGIFSSNGSITGPIKSPKIMATAAGQNLLLFSTAIKSLHMVATASKSLQSEITLQIIGMKNDTTNFDYLNIRSSGDLLHGIVNLDTKTAQYSLATSLRYQRLNPGWQVKLTQGNLYLSKYDINLKTNSITAAINDRGNTNLSGSFRYGTSLIQLKGTAGLLQTGLPLKLTFTGNKLLVINNPEYKIFISPNLTLEKKQDQYLLNGTIAIPTATISLSNFKTQSASLSDDVHFTTEKTIPMNTVFSGNIYIILGNNININVKGLAGQLLGDLQLHLNGPTPMTANGVLSITNGKYAAYGQNLVVSSGKIIYTGGLINNPGIELIASKVISTNAPPSNSTFTQNFTLPTSYSTTQQVTVGIQVTGNLQHYTANLFSNPAIYSQSDILSLLLIGQTAENLSGNNAQLLLKAASGLNLGTNTVGSITRQLQQFFGLDELGLNSENYSVNGTTSQGTALTLGKRLTSRLSINYSIGLLQPINIFLATYQLNKNWNLQADASIEDTGTDLFYNVEK